MIDLWLPPKPAIIRPAEKKLLVPALGSFLPGMFPAGAAAGSSGQSPGLLKTHSATSTAHTTTYTFTSVNFGDAAASRRIFVCASSAIISSGRTITGITIAGSSATIHVQSTVNNPGGTGATDALAAIASISDTTNTLGTVVVTVDDLANFVRIVVFSFYSPTVSTPDNTASDNTVSSDALSANINVNANGSVLAVSAFRNDSGTPTDIAWTNLTETDQAAISPLWMSGVAFDNAMSSQTGRTITATKSGGTTVNGCMAIASWH